MNTCYQCLRCESAYIKEIKGETGRFCSKFTYTFFGLNDHLKAKFTFRWLIWHQTKECHWVYRGWHGNCSGFKIKRF